ncbi:glycine oxidase [Paraglaciecola mesophila KMM 241]|uniref:Glycine oxidase n=1 Tax=Paraglaciecola mesophila KMM 241 TaxID=1128912 RepID=K6YKB3_9ALTE|nr:FAD-dependent oxidoreductase [Paraglaciecola mesophila]GAC24426.1 glycine oxidase [Paraglaciecola mesophila KMM 241]
MAHQSGNGMRIAIVGAGIMGRMMAWQLLQRQEAISLTIFDKDPIESGSAAAYTAAGMLAPYSELESADLAVFHMGLASLTRWPDVIHTLNSRLAKPLTLFDRGTLVVAHRQDKADFQQFSRQLIGKLPDFVQDRVFSHMQFLTQPTLHQYAPQLANNFEGALYLPNEAWVDTAEVMAGLADCLQQSAVKWHANTHVLRVDNEQQSADANSAAVFLPEGKHVFDYVIDCRGLGAKQDVSVVGQRGAKLSYNTVDDKTCEQQMPKLRGVRGEVITLYAPEVELKHAVRLMHPRYKLYIAPRHNHHFVIGASQIESEDTGPITVRSTLELLSAAYSIDAGFGEAKIVKTATNCRPAYPDNLPKVHFNQRVMRINGLFRHGYLLAPMLAEQACNRLFDVDFKSTYVDLIQEVAC